MIPLPYFSIPHHVEAVSGFMVVFRNIVDAMDAEREKEDVVQAGEVAHWIAQLDFIGNALANQNDELIDSLREHGVATVLATGSIVTRATAPPKTKAT